MTKQQPTPPWVKWHGWKRTDRPWTLHIGPIPERKRPALYVAGDGFANVLAWFRDEVAAAETMECLDALIPVAAEEKT